MQRKEIVKKLRQRKQDSILMINDLLGQHEAMEVLVQ